MIYLRRPRRPPLPLLLLLLLLSLTLAAAHPFHFLRQLLPATTARIEATDLVSTFTIVAPKQQCGANVTHLRITRQELGSFFILHQDILLDNVRCSTGGTTLIFTKEFFEKSDARVLLGAPPLRPVVEALDTAVTSYLLGIENSDRICGRSDVRPEASFVFFRLTKPLDLTIPTTIENQPLQVSLKQGFIYMIALDPARNPCVYSTPVKTVTPSPQPTSPTPVSPTPAPSDPSSSSRPTPSPEVPDESIEPAETQDPADRLAPTDPFGDPTEQLDGGGAADDSVCFPAAATVTLEDGRTKTMQQLQLGDRVQVAPGEYSEVFMFTHRLDAATHVFLRLQTAAGPALALTPGHYLYVNGRLAAARTIVPGDRLELASGHRTRVVAVARHAARGLYNPQTLHGDIIVDGLRASTYTTAVAPPLAHVLLAPLRLLFRIGLSNPSASLLDGGADALAALLPAGRPAYP